jgi:hypothetical protein
MFFSMESLAIFFIPQVSFPSDKEAKISGNTIKIQSNFELKSTNVKFRTMLLGQFSNFQFWKGWGHFGEKKRPTVITCESHDHRSVSKNSFD